MEKRCLERGQASGRQDDNIETIKKRVAVYYEQSLSVVSHYEKKGLVKKLDAMQTVDQVFEQTK